MSVLGLSETKRAFRALPDIARESMADATEETIEQMRAGAVRDVPVRYGFLRDRIAAKMSRKTGVGKVGVTRGTVTTPDGRTVNPGQYARFAEFGTRHHDAQPFMLPAADEQKPRYLDRCRKAGKAIERDTARIGMRNI